MSENDLDLLYERAAGHDQARPSTAVRQAILDEARQLAAHAHASSPVPSYLLHGFAHWLRVRWQIAAPVAAAVLAAIVLQPQLRSKLPTPARQNSAPAATHATASEPVRPQTANFAETPPIASGARSAPEPFPAEAGLPQSDFSSTPGAPSAASPAAPAAAPAASASNLASSADLRERTETQSETARASVASDSELQQAVARGDAARVRSLVQMNAASINARDTRGRTALLLAVLHRHESVVRVLLDGGADPNLGDADGRTPLAIAREQNQLSVAAALRQAGAR